MCVCLYIINYLHRCGSFKTIERRTVSQMVQLVNNLLIDLQSDNCCKTVKFNTWRPIMIYSNRIIIQIFFSFILQFNRHLQMCLFQTFDFDRTCICNSIWFSMIFLSFFLMLFLFILFHCNFLLLLEHTASRQTLSICFFFFFYLCVVA